MCTAIRLGRRLSGQRRVGVGWRPVTRAGWLITLVAVALVVGVLTLLTPSVPLAIGLALALLAADLVAWRVVSRLFDRERLVTGHASTERT